MIDSVKDLGLDELNKEEVDEKFWELLDQRLQEKMGLSLEKLKQSVCNSIKERAEELALDLSNIAPYGDYGSMLEDNDSMANFLKKEASKPENWKLYSINVDTKNENLLKFLLFCKAVDDGDVIQGVVFTNKSGVIRHAFCQVDI